jgi:hypothetical protein
VKRLLKRWAAVLWVIPWLVMFYGLILFLAYLGLVWLVTGHSGTDAALRYMELVWENYWAEYRKWAQQ